MTGTGTGDIVFHRYSSQVLQEKWDTEGLPKAKAVYSNTALI